MVNPTRRVHLEEVYVQVKHRIRAALSASEETSFGARVEIRLTRTSLHRLIDRCREDGSVQQTAPWSPSPNIITPPGASPLSPATADIPHAAHRQYWVLPTREVNRFIAAELGRWMLGVEALACRALPTLGTLETASAGQQLLNGYMMTIMFRFLRMTSAGQDPSRDKFMWKKSWDPPAATNPVPVVERSDTGSDVEAPLGEPVAKRLGIGLKDALVQNSIAWIRSDRNLVYWNVPCFTDDAVKQMALPRNGL